MSTRMRSVVVFCLTVVLPLPVVAQINITAADVRATFALGTTITSRIDTVTKTANIGTPGATSWDFSALNTHLVQISTSVRPDTTPFIGLFPGSTHVLRESFSGFLSYSYFKLETHLLFPGMGVTGVIQQRTVNVPEATLYQLPMTLGTSWTTTFAESSIVALPPPYPPRITVTDLTVTNTVDAYGVLTLPGGGARQALRLRTDTRSSSDAGSTRTVSYSIVTLDQASVGLTAADTLQANSGTINVSSISWTGPVTSGVRLSDAVAAEFALMQNYPNPFNPSTIIPFMIAARSVVILKVCDLLGRVVATLIHEELLPGSYEARFDGTHLASGVYFSTLQAGPFTQTRKIFLLK
jgi:hypothetical protein